MPCMCPLSLLVFFFFFNDTATTEIYTLSLHDALPIWDVTAPRAAPSLKWGSFWYRGRSPWAAARDRKSTRLNSSHGYISYAVFCFRKNTRLNSSHGYISYAVFCLKKKTAPRSHQERTR